jgi:hypothetical protein
MSPYKRIFAPFERDVNFVSMQIYVALTPDATTSTTSPDNLIKRHEFTKLGERWDGPYPVQRSHVNGTLTLEFRPGLTKRVNIRRIKPFTQDGFRPP